MKWPLVTITAASGPVRAVAPTLLAVSRATDIPAFYMPWFMKRLEAGYACWVNPFSGKPQYVSLSRARAVVFWSKNPLPLIAHLPAVEARGLESYVQYTLNDYEAEGWEPGVPPLARRVETFRRLAEAVGPDRVVWRFDPLMLAANPGSRMLSSEDLLERVERLAQALAGCTTKLVFSFADIAPYRKVAENLRRKGMAWREEMSYKEVIVHSRLNKDEVAKMHETMSYREIAEKKNLRTDSVTKITNKEIGERAGINEETVGRCISGTRVNQHTLILICLALHLPYLASMKILNTAGEGLKMVDKSQQWYHFVLMNMYGHLVTEVKDFLSARGADPL